MLITCASAKGGVGKTTSAVHLAFYKFAHLSHEEMEAMLELALAETRIYQAAIGKQHFQSELSSVID